MKKPQPYQLHNERLSIDAFMQSVGLLRAYKKPKQNLYYLNVSASFDIETTSFYWNKETGETIPDRFNYPIKEIKKNWEKHACMYCWVFTLNGFVTTGRTWDEFKYLLGLLKDKYGIGDITRLPIYVHNLSFEMAFIGRRFDFVDVFALAEREPLKALTSDGFEFRDSLALSGYSLATTGENLQKYKVSKDVGDLDYSKMRNSKTILTEKEWKYVVDDGLVVSAYIQEQIEEYKSVMNIPMTKTGVVRRYLRNCCFYGSTSHKKDYSHKYERYSSLMRVLTLEKDEALMLERAFMGGIVHCSCINEGHLFQDVTSFDFTSSYPYCLIAFKYPMSKGVTYVPKDYKDFRSILESRLAVFDIEFTGLQSRYMFEHVISSSKCYGLIDPLTDNGRIVSAKRAMMTITSVDFKMFEKFYRWKKVRIGKMYIYKARYLPTDFVKAIVELYKTKTTLKDVDDELSKARYQWAKEQLNSVYGCCVQKIFSPKIKYVNGEWITEQVDIDEQLENYNNDRKRFNFYAWGVFCTAFARSNLASGLLQTGVEGDYIYCDTDSMKVRHAEKYKGYIEEYNEKVRIRLLKACRYHGLELDDVAPKTIEGKVKMLGVWDKEYVATKFIALRAKCYAYETKEHGFSITIAGVNKKVAVPKLIERAKKEHKSPFDYIKFGFTFDYDTCGKNLHSYIDKAVEGDLMDFQGHLEHYKEFSAVHLEPTKFDLNCPEIYLDFLTNVKERGVIA